MRKLRALWLLLTAKHYFLTTTTNRAYYVTSSTVEDLENFTVSEIQKITAKRNGGSSGYGSSILDQLLDRVGPLAQRMSEEEIRQRVEDVCPCPKCVKRRAEKQKDVNS